MKNIVELTENSFEREVRRAGLPVVVDFYAPWCGPCKMLAPLLEQFAADLQGRVKFAKLNVDDAPRLAAEYNITGVPTLALFRGGQPVDALVGLVSPRALQAWLEGAAAATPVVAEAAPL
jgi:thioredoxin 1